MCNLIYMKNKIKCALTKKSKGISAVIETIGILLVTVLIIVLFREQIWGFVQNMLNSVSGELNTISNWGVSSNPTP